MSPWTKWPWWQGRRLCMGAAWILLTVAKLTMVNSKSPICQQYWSKPNPWYDIYHGDHQLHGENLIHWTGRPAWKTQNFILTEINLYYRCELAFPEHNSSAKYIIIEPSECLVHHHDILPRTASHQGTQFIANKMWQWAQAHEIHWFQHVLHRPEARDLIEWQNGLLTIQLQHQPWNYLTGWGNTSRLFNCILKICYEDRARVTCLL